MQTFAAIDIGSNSCRLKIGRVVQHRLRIVHEDREVTRLGGSVFDDGHCFSGGDGGDAADAEALLQSSAVARNGQGARGGHVGDARCAQFAGVSGVGAGRDGMGCGDHLRARRGAADPSRCGGKRAGRRRALCAGGCGRRKLRDYALRTQANAGDDQPAAGRGAADAGIRAQRRAGEG